VVSLEIKSARDAERLKEELEGVEWKSIWVQSRREYWEKALSWLRMAIAHRTIKGFLWSLKKYIKLRFLERWEQRLYVYSVQKGGDKHVEAYFHPPWRVVVRADGYVYFKEGGAEKVYNEVEVDIDPNSRLVQVTVVKW